MRRHAKTRSAFTLVELVVVIMILGILAALAAPRMLGASRKATDNGVRQTLSVIRDAIDHYAADHNGALPGADGLAPTFVSDISGYIRGGVLPMCPVDASRYNDVYILTPTDLPGNNGGVATHAYCYNHQTGEFHINSPDLSSDEVTPYSEF